MLPLEQRFGAPYIAIRAKAGPLWRWWLLTTFDCGVIADTGRGQFDILDAVTDDEVTLGHATTAEIIYTQVTDARTANRRPAPPCEDQKSPGSLWSFVLIKRHLTSIAGASARVWCFDRPDGRSPDWPVLESERPNREER